MANDTFGRPAWDDYFMSLAFMTAQRSIDPNTKHGCVITRHRKILATGYNGPPAGLRDNEIPLTRPEKYSYMVHAEENAILNSDVSLAKSVAYVTGHPCHRCIRMLMQKGIVVVIYGPMQWQQSEEDRIATETMLKAQIVDQTNMTLEAYDGFGYIDVLENTLNYNRAKFLTGKKQDCETETLK
jgi:dCMP deaminase